MAEVTQATIAKMTGASRATVSLVLTGRAKEVRISDERARKIMDCARRLNYVTNSAALTIRRKRSYNVGVLLLEKEGVQECITSNFLTILGINDSLQAGGYVMSLIRHVEISKHIDGISRTFKERLLDGLIILSAMDNSDLAYIREFFSRCVWVDTSVWEPTCCIQRDETGAGYEATMALINSGHRKLLYVDVEKIDVPRGMGGRHYSFVERRKGVEKAALEHGIELVFCGADLEYVSYSRHEGRVAQAMNDGFGIVVYDVPRAECVLQTALKNRLVPGIDFGLACCESSSESDRVWPHLTRVDYDRREMGRRAGRMIHDLIENPKSSSLRSKVIKGKLIRGSTCRVPKSDS